MSREGESGGEGGSSDENWVSVCSGLTKPYESSAAALFSSSRFMRGSSSSPLTSLRGMFCSGKAVQWWDVPVQGHYCKLHKHPHPAHEELRQKEHKASKIEINRPTT